jgi:hypothetical protein
MNHFAPRSFLFCTVALLLALGCSDETTSSNSSNGGNGGTGANTGGNGGAGANTGGMGGAGGGMGGAGGVNTLTCLDASEHDAVFTIDAQGLCLVEKYSLPLYVGFDPNTFVIIVPTWGRHGGPLTMEQASANGLPVDEITLRRWALPMETSGDLTVGEQLGPLQLGAANGNPFLNPTAVDLPFNDWTIVAYDDFGAPSGEAFALNGTTVEQTFDVNGFLAVVGVSQGANSRMLHASASPIGTPAVDVKGMYASDICQNPVVCNAETMHIEGDAGGPLAADTAGNVFGVFPDLAGGMQTLRGFDANEVGPMSAPSAGLAMSTIAGSGLSLAAMAPQGGEAGWVFFQVLDQNFTYSDPVAQRYDDNGNAISAVDATLTKALTMVTPGTEVTLMSDDQGRLWVGVADGAMATTSTLYVLDRAP